MLPFWKDNEREEDRVGEQTGLSIYHNIEGTGKNESMHRFTLQPLALVRHPRCVLSLFSPKCAFILFLLA